MTAKTPKLTPLTILSFDIESNGLHGPAFAVAGLLVDHERRTLAEFIGRCPIEGAVDPWVQDNVLPPMHDIPENFPTARSMRDAFWQWYQATRSSANLTLVNNPYPVEARFLIACQDDDLPARGTGHPFPLIDLASLLLAAGCVTREDRDEFTKAAIHEAVSGLPDRSHNPQWDAWAAAVTASRALDPRHHRAR